MGGLLRRVAGLFSCRAVDRGDFFAGGFDGLGEQLMLVHGQLAPLKARELNERLQRVAEDFARQHLLDQKLPDAEKRQYTLLMGMRGWLFERFRHLQRRPSVQR